MAVVTTAQDIITAAFSHSKKNAPGRIITEATEGVAIVNRALRGLYAYAARINPEFFGDSVDVPYVSPGWKRPEAAESVFRIELVGAETVTEVVVVPIDDRDIEASKPSVYRLGQIYRPAGNDTDPADTDSLTFFYAKRANEASILSDTLDPLWVEAYNELLALEVAIYVSLKDGRNDEVASLRPGRDEWLGRFTSFLEDETSGEVRRFQRRFITNDEKPLKTLLAGENAG